MTEVKEGGWSVSAPTRTVELPGLMIEIHPVITLRAVPGLRWLGLLVTGMLEVGCDLHMRMWRTAAPGFSYEQIMGRSADVRLPAAQAPKPG